MLEFWFNWKQLNTVNHKSFITFISPHCIKLLHNVQLKRLLTHINRKLVAEQQLLLMIFWLWLLHYTIVELSDTLHRKMNYFKSILIAFLLHILPHLQCNFNFLCEWMPSETIPLNIGTYKLISKFFFFHLVVAHGILWPLEICSNQKKSYKSFKMNVKMLVARLKNMNKNKTKDRIVIVLSNVVSMHILIYCILWKYKMNISIQVYVCFTTFGHILTKNRSSGSFGPLNMECWNTTAFDK